MAIYDSIKPLTGIVTDNDGCFSLKIEKSRNSYILAVEFIGYIKIEKIIVPNSNKINAGTILLKEDAISLNELVVTAKEDIQKSTIEHTTINASSNIASSKGSAIDILRTSPSVNISDNNIAIRGNSNILVLLDGVPTTVSDLSTIPSANIKSIEVVTNPDASHDAGGTGGIINIISKKTKSEGCSGITAVNYGFNHFFTGNIAFSYNKPKVSWRFGYNAKYEDDIVNSTLFRQINASNYQTFQQMRAVKYTFNNNINFGADFRINQRDRLSVDVKCIIPRLNTDQKLHNTFTDENNRRTEYRENDITWNRENVEASVAYTHIIKPDASDITFKGSFSKIWGHRPSYYSLDGAQKNYSESGGSPFIPTFQADYKHKFKKATLSSGVKLTYRSNDIYHRFHSMGNDGWEYSENLSNDLLHTEFIPAIYTMLSARVNKKLSYKAGLRGEFSTVTLKSSHENVNERNNAFFLAPSVSATYAPDERQEFSLAFSRRIGRPTYPQLNPYMSMIDATTYEQGNMHLNFEKTTKLDLSYNLQKESLQLYANGYVNYTDDYITQITTLGSNILTTTYINADYDLKTGAEFSLKVTPAKWLDISLGSNTYYVSAKSKYSSVEISNSGVSNNSSLTLDFLPAKNTNIQVQYFINSPQYHPQLTTSFTHQANIGIKQQMMKDKMTLSMLVTDILDTSRWKVVSCDPLFKLTNTSRNKSRMLWLGASYNFNSFKQRKTQKNEEDRSLIKFGM